MDTNTDELELRRETVLSAASAVIIDKVGGNGVCTSHISLKYKLRSKEFDFNAKLWRDETKDAEFDGTLHSDIYIVPIIDAALCLCDNCDVFKLVSPSIAQRSMRLHQSKQSVLKFKLNKQEAAKRNKVIDAAKVNEIRSMAASSGHKPRFISMLRSDFQDQNDGICTMFSPSDTN